ncbi:putative quinol monooxygenase [Nocardioides sp. GXQ0305]|uniref:putative quinol monooxygenase n=1 Tax=Nocardioides sp. GXQ0305 TaxID=3423912 RepID=UPI003D7EB202
MGITVVVEFRTKPGVRAELKSVLEGISGSYAAGLPGFLGSTVYEQLDDPDGLVEIAEWETSEAQATAVERAAASGVYAPVMELLVAPIRATRIGHLT